MDFNTTTREKFTTSMLETELPANASPIWSSRATKLKNLLKALAYDSAMASNLQQTYMTPAASKNKVYFMWDFIGRTLGMLFTVPSSLEGFSSPQQEVWNDVVSRSAMGAGLILDERPGMLQQMVSMSYPGSRHDEAFGDEVLEAARALKNEPSNLPWQT